MTELLLWLGGVLGLAFLVSGIIYAANRWGLTQEIADEKQKEIDAANARQAIDDNVSRLDPAARKQLLGLWSVPGVGTNQADKK